MSLQTLQISLTNQDALIDNRVLGNIFINPEAGEVSYVDIYGGNNKILMFEATTNTNFMLKSDYDTDNDGVIDNATKLGGYPVSNFATSAQLALKGDMDSSIYDIDNNGVVDDSDKLGGNLPSYYASLAYVNSTFGDMKSTIYDSDGNGVVDDSDKLGGNLPSYYLDFTNLTNKPSINDILDTSITTPLTNQILTFDGANWVNINEIDLGTF